MLRTLCFMLSVWCFILPVLYAWLHSLEHRFSMILTFLIDVGIDLCKRCVVKDWIILKFKSYFNQTKQPWDLLIWVARKWETRTVIHQVYATGTWYALN